MTRRLFAALAGLLLAAPATGQDARTDFDLLQGTWQPVSAELGGSPLPAETLMSLRLVIKGEEYSVTVGNETDRGTLQLDVKKKPRAMDIVGTDGPNKGKTVLAVYDLSADELKVCYALDGKRPTGFKTQTGDKHFLVTYQRVKP
jgi:uncharacterized protein (TIGR03067 family)